MNKRCTVQAVFRSSLSPSPESASTSSLTCGRTYTLKLCCWDDGSILVLPHDSPGIEYASVVDFLDDWNHVVKVG